MKSRLLLNIVLFLSLAGLVLYAYLRPTEDKFPEVRVTQLTRNEITHVRLERKPSLVIDMQKRNGNWYMLLPHQTRVQQLQIDRLLDIAMATTSEVLPANNLARYGLDPAPMRVTLNDQAFAFGSINDITNEQYLLTENQVYLVKTYLAYSVPNDPTKLISHSILGSDEIPVAFDFGNWQASKNDKGSWSIHGKTASNPESMPSADDMNQWVAEWQGASSLAVTPHDGVVRGDRVTIQFSNGKSSVIRILSREPNVQLLKVDENMRYEFGAQAGGRLLDPERIANQ